MAFYVPMEYKCGKCGHVADHSCSAPMSPLAQLTGETFCPHCFADWLRENIPVMEQTGRKGEHYRRNFA